MLPEEFVFKYRFLILAILAGLVLIGLGVFFARDTLLGSGTKIEVLDATTEGQAGKEIIVEVSGNVETPGVYKLASGSRVEDALIAAGGVSQDADRVWMEKSLNRAAKLADGQKIYIPKEGSFDFAQDEHSKSSSAKNSGGYKTVSTDFPGQGSGLININSATFQELDSLAGIGQVYAQNIIEHRPYSNIEELVTKGVLKKNVFEKIKDKITVY